MDVTTTSQTQRRLGEHAPKLIALAFWLALLVAYRAYAHANGLGPLQVVQQIMGALEEGWWGPLVYLVLYVLRPVVLFPSTVLTVAGGFVFGPVLGVLYTLVASNASATLAYFIGRFFGQGLLKDSGSEGLAGRYARRMRANSFETILIMRFIFLPYDAVSYLAGFLRIHYWPFILATALGSIPGTLAFVWFGASIERFDGGLPALNPVTLAASLGLFAASLVLSRLFRRREKGSDAVGTAPTGDRP